MLIEKDSDSVISLKQELGNRVRAAMTAAGAEGDPVMAVSQNPKFGDYQANGVMNVARALKTNPRELAARVVEAIDVSDMCKPPEVAGGGFINFRLKREYLGAQLTQVQSTVPGKDDRLGIPPTASPQRIVVDMSSPNLAKEMHIGHLRSTIIGDCVARVLEFAGHKVFRENHVGDWGTQFGMLVAHLRHERPDVTENPDSLVIKDLESFYIAAKKRFDEDDAFKTEARETVVKLQQGDETTRRIWRAFCDESLRHCHEIYRRLNVVMDDVGESAYADLMPDAEGRLRRLSEDGGESWVRESEGAFCVFPDGYVNKDGEPQPEFVRKSDGGFGYFTSDLACIIKRVEDMKADRLIYVVGIPQTDHFKHIFWTVRKAQWVDEHVELTHLRFANILSASGQPFKTRDGGTFKLKDVLDEAVGRARQTVESQMATGYDGAPAWSEAQVREIAETVGLGAVKYYDMARSLEKDYKFNLDSMCSLEGNTAPYMMYAYARIRSIARKAGVDLSTLTPKTPITLEHPAEIALALKIMQFQDVLRTVAAELKPNVLTDYLYDLAKAFSRFYDKKIGVRVIDAEPESVRMSRLRLCDLTARTLKLGLSLLGIGTVEQM
ncbi:MAG: arginine--tRNA ligase [Planctomycetota bacterium]|jgi:arginyl-tRNA synthetase